MRMANILTLGIKELRGLARDPFLMVLIVYAFTVNVYSTRRRSRWWMRTARPFLSASSMRSTRLI